MKLELIKTGDSRLKEICEEVTDFENKEYYQNLINKMTEASLEQYAFACAAPQFGIMKSFIVMIAPRDMKANNKEELDNNYKSYSVDVYFNPKIVVMKGKQYYYEACMSVGDVIGKVARPYYIEIEAQDIDGNFIRKVATGFEAIVFCHEIDHLSGIEFTDKAIDIIYDADLEKRLEIRKNNPHEIVSKDCEFHEDYV